MTEPGHASAADLEARVALLERERRRMFDDAQREADTMFAQYQLSQLLASGEALEPLARAVLAEIARATGASASALWLVSPGDGTPALVATGGAVEEPVPAGFASVAQTAAWATARSWSGVTLEETRDGSVRGVERSTIGYLAVEPPAGGSLDASHARYLALIRRELAITFRAAQLRSSLARERATLAAILEGASDAIVAVDADLRVVQLNAAAARLLGTTRAAATGAPCRDVLGCRLPGRVATVRAAGTEDHGRAVAVESLACGEGCPFGEVLATGRAIATREQVVRAQDREPVRVDANYAPTASGPVGAVAVLRDLRPALALDQMKSSFVAAVSHELRTPLALISGYAQSLLHLDLDAETSRRHLEQIEDAVGRLSELVDQILDTSQLESDRLALHRSAVDLGSIIAGFADEQRAIPGTPPLQVAVARGLPPVDADPARVGQVLANLVANSAKYGGPGVRVAISARRLDAHTVVTTVADDGLGIDPLERDHVFDRFYRGRAVRESRIAGSGLGLYLCRRLLESHGGWIRIDATVRGTSISFGLPIADERSSERRTIES